MPSNKPSTLPSWAKFNWGVATVQIRNSNRPRSFQPEALDAEFGREDEECAAAQKKQTGASMKDRFTPREADFPTLRAAGSPDDAIDFSHHHPAEMRPPFRRRVLRSVARFLIIFCVGVCSTLAWQSYGDAARAMIAKSSPHLGWLAPHPVAVSSTTPRAAAQASAASAELQQLAFGLAAIRQSVDLLTTQLASGQQQIGDEISKLRADEQEILRKLSATAPKPTASQAHKTTAVAASAPPSASAQAR